MPYEMDGDVYYSVEKFEHYGELSGRNLEDMMAGARVDVNDKSIIQWILPCGRLLNRESLSGAVPGVKDVLAGISNAQQ